MAAPFLTARWRHLINISYWIDPEILLPHVPQGLELDILHDKAFISVVAFHSSHTRLHNIAVPWHTQFPELHLRFYVRRGAQRGVVFIRHFVPKFFVAQIARYGYQAPYQRAPLHMQFQRDPTDDTLILGYQVKHAGRTHRLTFYMEDCPYLPQADGIEDFFKARQWFFGTTPNHKLVKYQVQHPRWRIYPLIKRFELKVDYADLFGAKWGILNGEIPYKVLVAEGSEVKLFAR